LGLLERIAVARGQVESRSSIDGWLTDYFLPAMNGLGYPYGPQMTYPGQRVSEIANSLPGYSSALRWCPPAFAAQMIRALVMSGTRFTFRNLPSSGKANKTFGTRALAPLESPWRNATTGQMVAQMEWHAGLAGNAYVTNRTPGRLRVLRPDWVALVYGSQQEPEDAAYALDGELIGYVYANGGLVPPNGSGDIRGMFNRAETLLPDEVAHYTAAGMADPEGVGIGMSWITPAIREVQKDRAATEHQIQFYKLGATPNLVVKGIVAKDREQFEDFVTMMESRHAGVANAHRTLYLTAGADATVVGSNMRDAALKELVGAGETRIAMLSRVHPVILAASEGLAGASLNAGNFSTARRLWADTWVYPTLADYAASLAPMVSVPNGAQLWFDASDMPILREDSRDAADIEQVKQTTIAGYINIGFTAESAIQAVSQGDVTLLQRDPNWTSVQLQRVNGPATGGQPAGAGDQQQAAVDQLFGPSGG
jgi:phage portal protein BeeE